MGQLFLETLSQQQYPRVATLWQVNDTVQSWGGGRFPHHAELGVFGLHLEATTRERLVANGAAFLQSVLLNCGDCQELVQAWVRPESRLRRSQTDGEPLICAPDLYMPASSSSSSRQPSRQRYLWFEPQYGVNNQLFAIVEAYLWARALDRQLVIPPIISPRISAFIFGDAVQRPVSEWPVMDSQKVLDVGFTPHQLDSILPIYDKRPVDFRTWLAQTNATITRVLRVGKDATFDKPMQVLETVMQQSNRVSSDLQVVNLRHLFERNFPIVETIRHMLGGNLRHLFELNFPTVETVRHLLGGCEDDVLAFDGMFFANIKSIDGRKLIPDVMRLSDGAESIYQSMRSKLIDKLGSSHFACFHVRMGDFVDMCHDIKTTDKAPGTTKTAQRFSCAVTLMELKTAMQFLGLPALVMSDDPAALQATLDSLSLKYVTSDWVTQAVIRRTAATTSSEERNVLSLLVEQQLCADADISLLNRFSTVSLRVRYLRRQLDYVYWSKRVIKDLLWMGLGKITALESGSGLSIHG